MAIYTAAQITELKQKLKTELLRRQYKNSVSTYGSSTYDFAGTSDNTVPSGNIITKDHAKKTINLILRINDYGNLYFVDEQTPDGITNEGVVIPEDFEVDSLITYVNELAAISPTAETSGCRGGCTGLCEASCASSCSGCYSSNSGSSGSYKGPGSNACSCSGCSSCSGVCKTSCVGNNDATGCSSCAANCSGSCSSCSNCTGCQGCSSLCTGCSNCSGTCNGCSGCYGGCATGCRGGCSSGCYGGCSSGCSSCSGSCSNTCTGTAYGATKG